MGWTFPDGDGDPGVVLDVAEPLAPDLGVDHGVVLVAVHPHDLGLGLPAGDRVVRAARLSAEARVRAVSSSMVGDPRRGTRSVSEVPSGDRAAA